MATQLLPERFPLPSQPLVSSARTPAGYLLQVLVLAALCAGGVYCGILLLGGNRASAPLWPPAGIAIASLLLLGPRFWPGVAVGVLLAFLGSGTETVSAIALAATSTLEALIPALVLRRMGWNDVTFERLRDLIRYLAVAVVGGPLLGTALSAATLAVHSGLGFPPVPQLLAWFLGSLTSVLLLGSLLITWLGPRPGVRANARGLEYAGMAGGLVVAGLLTHQVVPLYFVPTFPLLAWAALRTGPRGATLMSFALFAITTWATSGHAVLGHALDPQRILFLAGLNLTQGVTSLLLAASVAERRQADRVERELEDAYRALVAAAPFAVVGLDRRGRVTVWSTAAEQMFGWSASDVVGRELPTVPPGRSEEFARLVAGQAESVSGFETVRRRRDGSELEVSLTAWPMYDSEGRLSGAMEVHQDITERKQAGRLQQATYRISESALAAFDLQQLYTAIHRIVAGLMPARNLYIALYEAETDTLTFPYWSDERDARPQPRRARRGLTEYVIRTGRSLRDRQALITTLEARGEVESFGSNATDWLGVPLKARERTIGVLAVQSYEPEACYTERDQAILEFVSSQVGMAIERKRAEDAVRASERELRALFAAMRDVILVLDRDGRYLRVAPTSSDLLLREASELVGRRLHEVLPREQADRFLAVIRSSLASGRPTTIEYSLAIHGREVWFSAVATPLEADTVLWVARSVNEQKLAEDALRRSEEQLRQALKMEAVGRLAGGVAHDFNNLLTSVLGHADLAITRVHPSDPLHDDLLEIKSAGARAAALTQQLLAFSRKQVLAPRVLDLNGIVAGIARMLRRTIGEDIELITRLAPELGSVRADPVQMEQVILNLAVNARDAMPLGGRLVIETANVDLAKGRGVRVTVTDTGVGMSEEVRAHLFEPFFTTKEVGKGTGLGLATAYGIVQQSGGTISVTSAPGQGTSFLVDLPLVRGEPVSPERLPAPLPGSGSETILLVEDEDAVRNLTRRVLEHHGYQVLSAPSGEAAVEVSRQHTGPLHLLLTDVVMPGISGPRLAELLQAERPDLLLIFMSGYAATTLEQKILLDPASAFLQKPFTTEKLMRRVREVLDKGAPAP
jgi:PAS domain S-box-containing protein